MRRIWMAAIAGMLFCSLAAAQETSSPGPETGPDEPGSATAAGKRVAGGAAMTSDYLIGIEDVLNVRVWGESDLSGSVSVRPDGKITVPLVNEIYVEGLSPMQVREVVTKGLKGYINEPYVTVTVEEINSFKVFVLGEVNTQGVLTFQKPTRLLQALAHAGGVSQFAKGDITVVRESGGVETRITVNYKRLLSGDPRQENIFLKPGDTIIVGD